MVIRDGPACPHCGEVALYQKASAIYEAQTFRVRGMGSARTVSLGLALSTRGVVPVLAGTAGRGSAGGVNQSDLAARLAPPAPPRDPRPDPTPPTGEPANGEAFLWGALLAASLTVYLGFGALSVVLFLRLPLMMVFPVAVIGLAGAGALGSLVGPRWARAGAAARLERYRRSLHAWHEWEHNQARWSTLWHCSRCGHNATAQATRY